MEEALDPVSVDLLELESWHCQSLDWLLGNRMPSSKVIGVECGEGDYQRMIRMVGRITNHFALLPNTFEDCL